MNEPILALSGLHKRFGALTVTNRVNLQVAAGEKRAIIGPNGAGKTTLFNLISGALPPTAGIIRFKGHDITRQPNWKRVRQGLSRTFQKNNLFTTLSVAENMRLAVQRTLGSSYNMIKAAAHYHKVNSRVAELLEQVNLQHRADEAVSVLSYGEQRQLEIGLALATDPELLLLDEPTAGMSIAETARMLELMQKLPPTLTLLIVEHDMEVVFALADRITVLHLGQVLAEGTAQEMQTDQRVREVYLGAEV